MYNGIDIIHISKIRILWVLWELKKSQIENIGHASDCIPIWNECINI